MERRMKWGEEPTDEIKKEGREGDGKKEEVEEEEQVKQKAGYTCTECGADVRADAAKCPKCGAKFEEFEED